MRIGGRTLAVSRARWPGWVGTRRVAFRYVSSSPPLSTVRAAFTAHGATPLVNLHSTDYEASGSISTACTDAFLCAASSFASIPSNQGTACAFAGYLVRCLLFGLLLPKGEGPSPSVLLPKPRCRHPDSATKPDMNVSVHPAPQQRGVCQTCRDGLVHWPFFARDNVDATVAGCPICRAHLGFWE